LAKTKEREHWNVHVVGFDLVAPDQLLAHPHNFRRHPAKQREALRGSLNELGVIAPVIQNVLTGHLLDGHARVEEYLSAGIEEVPRILVEVPPEKESIALLSLDPIAAMAEADKEAMDALLRDVATTEEGLQAMFVEMAVDNDLSLPLWNNSEEVDDRGNRNATGKGQMVVSVGRLSAVLDYDLVQRAMAGIRARWGDDQAEALQSLCEALADSDI
jgi:hypothetical protein